MVFNLYVLDNFSHKEIGDMLNISPGTSKSHLARARKAIKEMLFGKSKDKKMVLPILFFAPKEDYIFDIYRNKLSGYKIQPLKPLNLSNQKQLAETKKNISSFSKSLIKNKLFLFSSFGILLIIYIFLFYNFIKNSNKNEQINCHFRPKWRTYLPHQNRAFR